MKKCNSEFSSRPAAPPLPTIIIDSREQRPLEFTHLPTTIGTLQTGDYSICGAESEVSFERKSYPDFVGSTTTGRERFWRELDRLQAKRLRRLFVIGTRDDLDRVLARRAVKMSHVLGAIHTINARYAPVVLAPDPAAAALMIESLAVYWWAWRARPFCNVEIPSWARLDIIPNRKELA